jgi:hypothetical protein
MSDLAAGFFLRVTPVLLGAGSSGVQVCQANPLRWGLLICQPGLVAGTPVLSPDPSTPNTAGWALSGTNPLNLHYRANPGLTTSEWFGGTTGGAVTVLVIEEIAQQ